MNKTTLSLAVAGLLMSAGAVSAADSMPFDVTATVTAACTIESTNALAFGAYNPVTAVAIENSTSVDVRCTNGHPYNVALNGGLNPDGTTRRMKIEGEEDAYLTYELYIDSERTTVWGAEEGVDTLGADGNGTTQNHTIHGRIAAEQETALLGTYADVITVSVMY